LKGFEYKFRKTYINYKSQEVHKIWNKRQGKPKGQSRMDNPETLAALGTQDEDKQIKISFHCGFCTCTLISSNQSTVSTECSLLIGQFSSVSTEKLHDHKVCKGSGMW
jgi:hypothetical protein